ncbi:hypothetical protein [Streptomyces dioscori]|uniref:hypothetical protein n=1 Tax=Streptomyces dioscori TaxID=2109333 RepID=UPI00131BCACB|nr:hypothetical protein [Streptomyces dioscori]
MRWCRRIHQAAAYPLTAGTCSTSPKKASRGSVTWRRRRRRRGRGRRLAGSGTRMSRAGGS